MAVCQAETALGPSNENASTIDAVGLSPFGRITEPSNEAIPESPADLRASKPARRSE